MLAPPVMIGMDEMVPSGPLPRCSSELPVVGLRRWGAGGRYLT